MRPIWNQLFDESVFRSLVLLSVSSEDSSEVVSEGADSATTADLIIARIVPIGQRFYPSESAFPLRAYNPSVNLGVTQ